MQFSVAVLVSALAAVVAADCSCTHNSDAGRWKDKNSPAGALATLQPGQCYQADTQGRMCLQGDASQLSCMNQEAANDQSYHGDWFLWTAITCGGLSMTITL